MALWGQKRAGAGEEGREDSKLNGDSWASGAGLARKGLCGEVSVFLKRLAASSQVFKSRDGGADDWPFVMGLHLILPPAPRIPFVVPEGPQLSPISSRKQEEGTWEGRTPTLISRKGVRQVSLDEH